MAKNQLNFKEIEHLYFTENLSQRAISLRLEVDQSTISRAIKKITKNKPMHKKVIALTISKGKLWRYHSLQFLIKPYYFYPKYDKIRKDRGNTWIYEKDYRVRLHDKSVEMTLRKGVDYANEDKFECIKESETAFNRTLNYIANKYGFEVWKEGRATIKLVKEHLAQTNSPLAKSRKGEYLQIKGIDGKVWFIIDKSKGGFEHEYIKANRVIDDSEQMEIYFNDLLYNSPPTNSELASYIKQSLEIQSIYNANIKKHLEVLGEISNTLKELKKAVKR